ncbi:MAG: serine/threonine-protein kinase [Polyangia bacterium]
MSEAEAENRRVPEAPTPLPQVFGRYLLLKRLSRGGMGEIFLAKLGEIQGFEKLVIIKKVLPNLAADDEFIRRFIDEAQVAIKLNHANVAPVFEVGRVDGEYFLGIAYIEGRDLRRCVSRLRDTQRKLSPDLALYIAREMAAGLAYAHRRSGDDGLALNLVHCDISPPNVMLSFEGEVKIIDFGIARSAIRVAQSNPNMGFGKFGYMAPEQLLRGGIIDKRTDLYAVGVILYELLTGERMVPSPEAGDYRAIARAVTQGKFPPPSEKNPLIPPELDALVMRAIAAKPENRYQTGEQLRDAIQTELARINPTLSSDQLSSVLRDLFADELTEERELLSVFQQVDLAPFREELTQATVEHTVTFARAPAKGPIGLPSLTNIPAVTSAQQPSSSVQLLESAIVELVDEESARVVPPAQQRRPWLLVLLAFGAMVVGAVVVLLVGRPKLPPSPPVVVHEPQRSALPPVVNEQPKPIVTQLPLPVEEHHPSKHHSKPAVTQTPEPHAAGLHTPEAVQAKFQKVRSEYLAFRAQYGGVLEEKWNGIASEITFGKADKYERVDALIDALRHEMARVRSGG